MTPLRFVSPVVPVVPEFYFSILSIPPMYGLKTSGTITLPSFC
jgi:hypothetical protein